MSVLIFIIILILLILAHEFGHFIVAKAARIRVDEFGIGFPPKIWGFKPKGSETEYTLNWIPFGGFVKIFGEQPDAESLSGPSKERSLVNKPKIVQAAVIAAGVFFNVLFAWILISAGFMYGLPAPVGTEPPGAAVTDVRLVITEVLPGSPAAQAGLGAGDAITGLTAGEDSVTAGSKEAVSAFIAAHEGETIALEYLHGQERATVSVAPIPGIVPDRGAIGVSMAMIGTLKLPLLQALNEGARTTAGLTAATVAAFGGLIADAFRGAGDVASLTGPVGIVGMVGDASDFGFVYLLTFTAFISINLAIINLIPFPALDGGRLLFLVIEALKGSPIKASIANFLNTVGFALLILLMLLVTYHDITKLVAG